MGRISPKERASRNPQREMIKQRTEAIAQMNPRLERKLGQIDSSLNDIRSENIQYYYRIGSLCQEIKARPDLYVGRDGTPGIKLIETALSTQARTLRAAAKFVELYDKDAVETLTGLTHAESNFRLNWGHVLYLLILDTEEQREWFAVEAVEKMMTPPELHDAIKKYRGASGGHGRKHEMPATVSGQVGQMHSLTKQWVSKYENVWDGEEQSVLNNVLNAPVEQLDDAVLERLEETRDNLVEMATKAQAGVERIERLIEHAREKLAAQRAADEAAAQATAAVTGGRRRRGARNIDLQGAPA